MNIAELYTDLQILKVIGSRLSRLRVDSGLTQQDLSKRSGVSKSTIERMESGKSTQLSTLVKVLRELRLLNNLDILIPEQKLTPVDYLNHKRKDRKRASSKSTLKEPGPKWEWGDGK